MKKILTLVLAMVMMLAMLASCATGGGDGSTTTDAKDDATTSATNTAVKIKFVVGDKALYELDLVVNADEPTIADAVKAAAKEHDDIALNENGDKLATVKEYKDCSLEIDGKDVMYFWHCEVNGKAKSKLAQTTIKADDEIVFTFYRGTTNAEDKYEEGAYDPSTNEYKDPDTVTEAA